MEEEVVDDGRVGGRKEEVENGGRGERGREWRSRSKTKEGKRRRTGKRRAAHIFC